MAHPRGAAKKEMIKHDGRRFTSEPRNESQFLQRALTPNGLALIASANLQITISK
jgi:hypothetical protein